MEFVASFLISLFLIMFFALLFGTLTFVIGGSFFEKSHKIRGRWILKIYGDKSNGRSGSGVEDDSLIHLLLFLPSVYAALYLFFFSVVLNPKFWKQASLFAGLFFGVLGVMYLTLYVAMMISKN